MKATQFLTAALAGAFFLAGIPAASAAEIAISCEKRANRSKISVNGAALTPGGEYRARVISGDNRKTSPPQVAVGDEAEFDFDSKPADIQAGATQISSAFIQNGSVTAKIINAAGRTVISDTELCRVR